MSALSQKMVGRRESQFETGGFSFRLRLPTALQAALAGTPVEAALLSVVGWSGVKQCDLLPGEPDAEAPFDADACREWLGDRLDLLGPIIEEIARLQKQRQGELEQAKKN